MLAKTVENTGLSANVGAGVKCASGHVSYSAVFLLVADATEEHTENHARPMNMACGKQCVSGPMTLTI